MEPAVMGGPADPKLQPPPPRPGWVERPDLIRMLDRAAARLILVAAPAGYGKTTLLAQWCAGSASGRSFAWAGLDAGDNDPAAFWRLLVQALEEACPALGVGALLPPGGHRYPDPPEGLLPGLISELAELAEPVTLVLDDYHVIREPACHQQLESLLLHLPPQAQIVLSTRAEPPLPLARLRAGGELAEIGMSELRLTAGEAAAVLAAVSGVRPGASDLHHLAEETEGWPTGVYLAALSLRGHPDPGGFIREFTGSNRYIGDFLVEEVISRQPERIQQFLARTSILGRLAAPLCDAVTGATDAHEIIEALETENVFLVALDDRREWFRYHRLFGEALADQLTRTEPGIIPILHLRASVWHRQLGSPGEAICHALAAGDTAAATSLIAEHWPRYADTGRIASVQGWLRSLGDECIQADPLAAHCAAWTAALSGDRETAMRWLAVVEDARRPGGLPDGMTSLESSAALLNGVFGYRGLAHMQESAAKAVALERDEASPTYALARAALGTSLYFQGDLPGAARWLQEAVMCQPSLAIVRLAAATFLALVAVEQDRPGQAGELATVARGIVADREHGLDAAPQGAYAHLAAGAADAARGQPQEARQELEYALRARRRHPGLSPWLTLEVLLRLAPVLQDLGDADGAAALLGEAGDILAAFPDGTEAQRQRLEKLERRLQARARPEPFPEPLTAREEAVLRSLRGNLSLREIGLEMYVSANTVKTHTRAIYRKLGVSSRRDAIRRGRELGIL